MNAVFVDDRDGTVTLVKQKLTGFRLQVHSDFSVFDALGLQAQLEFITLRAVSLGIYVKNKISPLSVKIQVQVSAEKGF